MVMYCCCCWPSPKLVDDTLHCARHCPSRGQSFFPSIPSPSRNISNSVPIRVMWSCMTSRNLLVECGKNQRLWWKCLLLLEPPVPGLGFATRSERYAIELAPFLPAFPRHIDTLVLLLEKSPTLVLLLEKGAFDRDRFARVVVVALPLYH